MQLAFVVYFFSKEFSIIVILTVFVICYNDFLPKMSNLSFINSSKDEYVYLRMDDCRNLSNMVTFHETPHTTDEL